MVANTSESSANKTNGLRLVLHFLENALGMDVNGLPTVSSTCKCLRMAYEDYNCLTNALLVPSDLNGILHFRSWVSQQHFHCHDTFLVQRWPWQ